MNRDHARRAAPIVFVAVCAAVLLVPRAALAQDEAFRAGLDAQKDRKWQEMATQMRRAIDANPKEDPRKVRSGLSGFFGGGGTEYLPHYFLGEALFNLQDCAGAVAAWAASEQQGVVKSTPEYLGVIRKGYAACEAKGVLPPAKYEPLLSRTRVQVTEVSTLAGSISALAQANIDLWHPGMREQYDRAAGELQNARSRLEMATRTRAERDFSDAVAAAERARSTFNTLSANLTSAIETGRSIQRQARDVEGLLLEAEAHDRDIERLKALLSPGLRSGRQTALEAIGRARTQVAAAASNSNVTALTEARTLAIDASTRLKDILGEARKMETAQRERRVNEALAAADEAFSRVTGAFATLEKRAAANPSMAGPQMTTEREALHKEYEGLQRRYDSSRRASNVARITDAAKRADDLRVRLGTLIESFGPMSLRDHGVDATLEDGVRLFLAGEYEQALGALDPARLGDIPFKLHMHLFRAAALYALYVRSGEADETHRRGALVEIERCRELNPAFTPDPRAFSPRFLEFFQSGPAAAAPAAPSSQP